MKSKPVLEENDLKIIIKTATQKAQKNNQAISVAVVDDGGHLLAFWRMDHATAITSQIAQEKARITALGRKESKVYQDIINQDCLAFLSAPFQGMIEGGAPILYEGQCVGAVGVSGLTREEDAAIAKAAAKALIK